VALLQSGLNKALPKIPALKPDGIFGPKTDDSVRAFQSGSGLKVDGVVGQATLGRLFQGINLQATVKIRPIGAGARPLPGPPRPGPTPPTPVSPFPDRIDWIVNPFRYDPRDAAWHQQVAALAAWWANPVGKMPPLPTLVPPSLSLPSGGMPTGPGDRIVATAPNRTQINRSLPMTGGGLEVEVEGKAETQLKDGKFASEYEVTFKANFGKIAGLVDTDLIKAEIEGKIDKSNKLQADVKVTVTPFKIVDQKGDFFSLKIAPLIVSSLTTAGPEGSLFAGGKGLLSIRPFGKGIEIELGGKLGTKGKISVDEDTGRLKASVYGLNAEATLGLKVEF
jgi:hypothetical protein